MSGGSSIGCFIWFSVRISTRLPVPSNRQALWLRRWLLTGRERRTNRRTMQAGPFSLLGLPSFVPTAGLKSNSESLAMRCCQLPRLPEKKSTQQRLKSEGTDHWFKYLKKKSNFTRIKKAQQHVPKNFRWGNWGDGPFLLKGEKKRGRNLDQREDGIGGKRAKKRQKGENWSNLLI